MDITGPITLRTVVIVLFILSLVWLFRTVIKKEQENILRAVFLSLFFLAALLFIQDTQIQKISFPEIKEKLFPKKPVQFTFQVEKRVAGGVDFTRYIFPEPGPKLSLAMDPAGNHFHLSNIVPLNDVLEFLGLPKVSSGRKELAAITGSRFDINKYLWDDYPDGILLVERAICRDRDRLETYHCLSTITITKRY